MAQGESFKISELMNIPISILLGVAVGAVFGYILSKLFDFEHAHNRTVRNSVKTIIMLGAAFSLIAIETMIKSKIPFSGLLAVVSMACTLKIKSPETVSKRLSDKLGKLWLAAEVVLFVLVGAAVDVRYISKTGFSAIGIIFVALVFRLLGVMVCLIKTPLTAKERLFCSVAYTPKATVQAAIGALPLAMGLACGNIVLSVAVIAILITAPLGALGIDLTYKKLLQRFDEDKVE